MAENSHISWTTHTFNTHWGCTKVSGGCKNCYADALAKRFGNDIWGPTAARKPMSEGYWKQLDKWEKEAARTGVSPRVFCNSMSDLFEGTETCQNPAAYAVVTAARERLFAAVERTPHLLYLLLTKRPENMRKFAPKSWESSWPGNVMAGTSVEDQAAADSRIPDLLAVPASRFLSMEPLLGPMDLTHIVSRGYLWNVLSGERRGTITRDIVPTGKIDWVIVGGESGPGARPMRLDWARALRDQCAASQTLFHFKQWGEHAPLFTEINENVSRLNGTEMARVGKRVAGRLLDGRTWDEVPPLLTAGVNA